MANNTFKFRCSECNNKLSAPLEIAGQRIRCPHCDNPITIPQDPTQSLGLKAKDSPENAEASAENPNQKTRKTIPIKISDTIKRLLPGRKNSD